MRSNHVGLKRYLRAAGIKRAQVDASEARMQAKMSSKTARQGRRGKGVLSRVTPLQRSRWYRDLRAYEGPPRSVSRVFS